jgi:hypothetical protein
MTKTVIILLVALGLTSTAIAQPYYRTPPIEVYAQRPYYQGAPPAVMYPPPAYALGGLIGGIVSLPLQFLGGLLGVPQYPQSAMVPDGMGGSMPFTSSRVMPDGTLRQYDPGIDGLPNGVPSGPYPSLAPVPEQRPAYYDSRPPHVHHAPRRPEQHAPWQWHDPNPSPERLPDTREWKEPNGRG